MWLIALGAIFIGVIPTLLYKSYAASKKAQGGKDEEKNIVVEEVFAKRHTGEWDYEDVSQEDGYDYPTLHGLKNGSITVHIVPKTDDHEASITVSGP